MLYWQDVAQTKPSRETIGYHIKALLPYWGDKTLAQVKGSTCRAYLSKRSSIVHGSPHPGASANTHGLSRKGQADRSVSPSTVRRELKTLSAAINHWHKESPLAMVPQVTLPPEGERRARFLERHEAAAMLRAAHRLGAKHVARFILIGLHTGTRHEAILKLRWSASLSGGHIDLERGIIFRRGAAERETSKRRPPVQIGQRLRNYLVRWRRLDGEGISHIIHYHGAPIAKMKRAWATVVKEAGLGKDVTPHTLRHTCATWALWKGKTIWEVAGLIGADASTVERTYGHHRTEQLEEKRA
jgi:integrase